MNLIEDAMKRLAQEEGGSLLPWPGEVQSLESYEGQILEPPTTEPDAEAPNTSGPPSEHQAAANDSVLPAAITSLLPKTHCTIDLVALRAAGYLVADDARSEMAEQFRLVKRPLLKHASSKSSTPEQRGSLVMVTSALPGEGKTFCSINLAMSIAMEVDTAVLLIDADVVRPQVFNQLGITVRPPGLLDLLTDDKLLLAETLVSTNVPNLTIMGPGSSNRRSTELLASAAMDRLLTELAAIYAEHIVIFDASPLLVTTESSVLAPKVGQVLMVVEAAKTPRNSVERAFAALRNCPVVVSVLNKCEERTDISQYGYYS